MSLCYEYGMAASPVGDLKLVASENGLVAVLWPNDNPAHVKLLAPTENTEHPMLVEAARQLNEYFAGERRTCTVVLDPQGTAFQKRVWDALLTIPFGETRSYAQIAQQIGEPTAYRAVGAANGRNPLSIIAPCHQVIGTNGALTGFAGGLATKQKLLALEGGATAA